MFIHWFYVNVFGNFIADLMTAVPVWIIGYMKLKKQHDKHHQQLKDHIDYRFSKLTEDKSE
jgi:hypothetical protein